MSSEVAVLKALVEQHLSLFLYDSAKFYAERLYYESSTADNLHLLAQCFFRQGKIKQTYLLLQNSEWPANRYLFAVACLSLGKFEEAERALNPKALQQLYDLPTEQLLHIVPGGAAGLYLLGSICRREQRKDAAIEYFKKSLCLDPAMWSSIAELCELGVVVDTNEIFGVDLKSAVKATCAFETAASQEESCSGHERPKQQQQHEAKNGVFSSTFASVDGEFEAPISIVGGANHRSKVLERRRLAESLAEASPLSPRAAMSIGLSSQSLRVPFATPGSMPSPLSYSHSETGLNVNKNLMFSPSPHSGVRNINIATGSSSAGRSTSSSHHTESSSAPRTARAILFDQSGVTPGMTPFPQSNPSTAAGGGGGAMSMLGTIRPDDTMNGSAAGDGHRLGHITGIATPAMLFDDTRGDIATTGGRDGGRARSSVIDQHIGGGGGGTITPMMSATPSNGVGGGNKNNGNGHPTSAALLFSGGGLESSAAAGGAGTGAGLPPRTAAGTAAAAAVPSMTSRMGAALLVFDSAGGGRAGGNGDPQSYYQQQQQQEYETSGYPSTGGGGGGGGNIASAGGTGAGAGGNQRRVSFGPTARLSFSSFGRTAGDSSGLGFDLDRSGTPGGAGGGEQDVDSYDDEEEDARHPLKVQRCNSTTPEFVSAAVSASYAGGGGGGGTVPGSSSGSSGSNSPFRHGHNDSRGHNGFGTPHSPRVSGDTADDLDSDSKYISVSPIAHSATPVLHRGRLDLGGHSTIPKDARDTSRKNMSFSPGDGLANLAQTITGNGNGSSTGSGGGIGTGDKENDEDGVNIPNENRSSTGISNPATADVLPGRKADHAAPPSKGASAAGRGGGGRAVTGGDDVPFNDEAVANVSALLTVFANAYRLLCAFRCRESIALLHSLPRRHFLSGWVQHMLGKAYCEINEYRPAVLALKEMIRLEPFRIKGTETLSTALWHLKRDKDLCSLAQQVVEVDKFAPETWCVVGNCFSLQREPEAALKFFQRALQVDPAFTYAHTLCGHEQANNEDMDKAVQSFRNSILQDDRHYNAWYGLGSIYYRQEKYVLAEYHFRRALGINPSSSVLLCYLSMALHAQGNDKKSNEALGILAQASAADPKNPQLHYQRAHIYLALEQPDDALCALELVLAHAPKEPQVYALLGQTFQQLGNTHEALKNLNIALALDPKESTAMKAMVDSIEDFTLENVLDEYDAVVNTGL